MNKEVVNTKGDIIWNNQQQAGIAMFINLPKTTDHNHYELQLFDLQPDKQNKPIKLTFTKNSNQKKRFMLDLIIPNQTLNKPYKFTLSLVNKHQPKPVLLLLAQP